MNSGKPKNGNPEPSLTNDIKVVRKVQRLRVRNQTNKLSSAPHPLQDDEIVHTLVKTGDNV